MKLKVEKLMRDKRVDYRLIRLSQHAYTVDDVVKYSEGEVNPDEICKTIILSGKKTGKKVATTHVPAGQERNIKSVMGDNWKEKSSIWDD